MAVRFAFTNKVRREADARIANEHAAVDLSNIYLLNVTGEDIADGGFEVERIPTSLAKGSTCPSGEHQGQHRCLPMAGHGVGVLLPPLRHHRLMFSLATRAPTEETSSPRPSHDDVRLQAEFVRNFRNMRLGLFHMNGMAIEDPNWTRGYDRQMRGHGL